MDTRGFRSDWVFLIGVTLEQSCELQAGVGWHQCYLGLLNIKVESSVEVYIITDGEEEKIAYSAQKEASSAQEGNVG
jgi:hypothetical protein